MNPLIQLKTTPPILITLTLGRNIQQGKRVRELIKRLIATFGVLAIIAWAVSLAPMATPRQSHLSLGQIRTDEAHVNHNALASVNRTWFVEQVL